MAGLDPSQKVVDAYLDGSPFKGLGIPKALPVAKVRLKVGQQVEEVAVAPEDNCAIFTLPLQAGPLDLEATLLDKGNQPICGAFYVYVRPEAMAPEADKPSQH